MANNTPNVGGWDTSPIPAYVMPTVHSLTQVQTDNLGFPVPKGYRLFGRTFSDEIKAGIAGYAANTADWATANTTAKAALITDTTTQFESLRVPLKKGFAPETVINPNAMQFVPETYIHNVPTTNDQRARLAELALAAKSLLESPEIDETQNAQLAAGLSAAMGGGHSSVPAIKDNITFEQKLAAKQLAFATYAQALDTYYKTYTASAMQVGQIINPASIQVSAGTPTVVPYESQLAGDIFANWQDTLNTGQMRDQQMRQTAAGAEALKSYYDATSFAAGNLSYINLWSAETTASVMGIRSQFKAAATY